MKTMERIAQAIVFEALALALSIGGLAVFTDHEITSLSGTMLIVASIAMGWNFAFNWIFDQFYIGDKTERTVLFRVYHVTLFELGLLVLTIPVISFILNIGVWEAFVMDVGITIFITIYAFVFNWTYDNLRALIVKKSQTPSGSTI